MPRRDDTPRDLLFGLLALQNGMETRDRHVRAVSLAEGLGSAYPQVPAYRARLADGLRRLARLKPDAGGAVGAAADARPDRCWCLAGRSTSPFPRPRRIDPHTRLVSERGRQRAGD